MIRRWYAVTLRENDQHEPTRKCAPVVGRFAHSNDSGIPPLGRPAAALGRVLSRHRAMHYCRSTNSHPPVVVAEGLGAEQQRGKADQKNAHENLTAPPVRPPALH